MSQEFIEVSFPCKGCLVQAACKDIDRVESIHRKDFERSSVLAIPIPENDKAYHKMLIECWVNMGNKIIQRMQKVDQQGTLKDLHVPTCYIGLMSRMAALMEYMINSRSWEDGKPYDFDSQEINYKLHDLYLKL